MSFYEDLEDSIVQRIVDHIGSSADVIPFPDNEAAFTLPYNKTRVTVVYATEEAGDEKSTSQVVQEDDIIIEVNIEGRRRRGSGGVWDVSEKVRGIVTGWIAPNTFKRMAFVSGKLERIDKDIWLYVQKYRTNRLYSQPLTELFPDDNDNGPKIKDVDFIGVEIPLTGKDDPYL